MILGGLLAVLIVGVKACQPPEGPLERFAVGSLKKLTTLDTPPVQPLSSFQTPDGEVSLVDYRGKIVVLNVWATWCPPCVAEMPSLDALQGLRGGDDFAVVPVSLDRRLEEIPEFYERTGVQNLPIIWDKTFSTNSRLRLPGLPTTIIYDRGGREIARLPGEADWASDEALALVDHLIAR